jgi:hypothetical protein
MLRIGTLEGAFASPFLIFASLSALVLAVLLAIVLQSTNVFLFVAGIAFVPIVGIVNPGILLALFLFFDLLLPKLPLIPIHGYLVPIRIEDVFLACALLCLLVRYLIYREKPASNPLGKWMVVFCIVTGLSLLFGLFILGSVPGASIGFLFWLRTPEYFAATSLCLLGITSWQQHKRMMVTLLVFVSLIGVYGILQEFSLVPIFDAMHGMGEFVTIRFFPAFGEERLFSTFAGPYDLAAFYLIAIPILAALCVILKSRAARVALAFVLALSFYCFCLTYARAPLAGLVIALIGCFWMLGKPHWGIGLGLLCVLPALMIGQFAQRLRDVSDDPFSYYAFGGRVNTGWGDALSAASRSPLLGTGPASLNEGLGVDGLYFMLIGMWGLLGLVSFIVLIVKSLHLQRVCVQTSHNDMQRALAVGLFAGTLGLLVNAITVDSFFISKVAFAYWFLMGLLLAGRRLENETAERQGIVRQGVRAQIPSALPLMMPIPPAVSGT